MSSPADSPTRHRPAAAHFSGLVSGVAGGNVVGSNAVGSNALSAVAVSVGAKSAVAVSAALPCSGEVLREDVRIAT